MSAIYKNDPIIEKILSEAAAATGGLFSVSAEDFNGDGGEDHCFDKGEFRVRLSEGTLTASGVDESHKALVLFAAKAVDAVINKNASESAAMSIFDASVPMEQAIYAAARAGIKDKRRVVFLLEIGKDFSEEDEGEQLKETFDLEDGDLLYIEGSRRFVIAKECENTPDPREFAESVTGVVTTELMVPIRITYSEPCDSIGELRDGLFQAEKTMRALQLIDREVNVLGFKERGAAGLIAELGDSDCGEYIEEKYISGRFPAIDEELKRAADKFLELDLNISETARAMYMHRNTFIYQLDKIEKQTGLNLRCFYDAMTYRLLMLADKKLSEERETAQ